MAHNFLQRKSTSELRKVLHIYDLGRLYSGRYHVDDKGISVSISIFDMQQPNMQRRRNVKNLLLLNTSSFHSCFKTFPTAILFLRELLLKLDMQTPYRKMKGRRASPYFLLSERKTFQSLKKNQSNFVKTGTSLKHKADQPNLDNTQETIGCKKVQCKGFFYRFYPQSKVLLQHFFHDLKGLKGSYPIFYFVLIYK